MKIDHPPIIFWFNKKKKKKELYIIGLNFL